MCSEYALRTEELSHILMSVRNDYNITNNLAAKSEKLNQVVFFINLHQNISIALNLKRAEPNVLKVLRPIFVKTILDFISVLQRSTSDSML